MGIFPELEEQMTQVDPDQAASGNDHYDRADAFIYGVTFVGLGTCDPLAALAAMA